MENSQSESGLTTARSDQLSGLLSENIVPVTSRELFWRAKFLRQSDMLGHLPFLFWLISDLRPLRTVTLNMGEGVSHFAACQAIEKTGVDALCLGFGSWDDAGVPKEVAAYNAEQYEEFSTLKEATPGAATRRVKKNSIDLLIIDGPLRSDVMDAVLKDWPARMTSRGIMVFSGLETAADEDADALDAWCEGKRTVDFLHSGGLRLVGLSEDSPAQALQLSQLDENSAAFMTIERVFSRLGATHQNEFLAQDKGQWARKLSDKLTDAEKTKTALESERAALSGKIKTLQEAYDARQKRAAQSEADLFDAKAALEGVKQDRDAALEDAKSRNNQLQGDLNAAQTQLDQLKQQLDATRETLKADADAAEKERTAFAALREDYEAQLQSAARDTQDLRETLAQLKEGRQALKTKLAVRADEAETLKSELEAERATLAEERDRLARQLEQALVAASDDAQALAEERDALRAKLSELSSEGEALKAELEAERAALAAARGEAQALSEERDALKSKLSARSNDAETLKAELEAERAALAEERDGLAQRLQDAQAAAREDVRALAEERDALKAGFDAERAAFAAERDALTQQLEDVQAAVQQEKGGADELLAQLEKSADTAIAAQDALKRELKQTQDERDALEQDLSTARSALEELHEDAKTQTAAATLGAQSEIAALVDALAARDEIIRDLTAKHQSAQDDITALMEQLAEAAADQEAEIATLTEMLDLETGQRIALSETSAAREQEAAQEAARLREDVASLTATLTLALEESEERSIARADEIKTLEKQAHLAQEAAAETLALSQARIDALEGELVQARRAGEAVGESQTQSQTRIDALQAELAQTRLARDTAEARHRSLSKENLRIQKMRDATEADLKKQIGAAQATARKQDKTIATLRDQVDAQQTHITELESAWSEMTGSTSWRVTAPLRQATSVLRKRK